MSQNHPLKPCHLCGHPYDQEPLGRYGCQNGNREEPDTPGPMMADMNKAWHKATGKKELTTTWTLLNKCGEGEIRLMLCEDGDLTIEQGDPLDDDSQMIVVHRQTTEALRSAIDKAIIARREQSS